MVSAYSFFLAIRYLVSRRVNLLGTIGVAVAVWALIVVIAVFSGFIAEIREHIRYATPDLLLTELKRDSSFEAIEPVLRADRDVVSVAPRLRHYAMYYPHNRGFTRTQTTKSIVTSPLLFDYVELLGVEPELEQATTGFSSWVAATAGTPFGVPCADRPLEVPPEFEARRLGPGAPDGGLLSASPGVLMGRKRLLHGRMGPGRRVDVLTGRFDFSGEDTEVRKIRRQFAIAGGFETKHPGFDDATAIVDIWQLREMLGHDGISPDSKDIVTDVAIRVRDGVALQPVADRLVARCREAGAGGQVLTWEQQNRMFLGAVDQERGMMKLILFAVMLVAAFLVYATLHMMVTQKIKDIGILSSMGATPGGVLNIFLLSGCAVALLGCAIGTLSGCLSAYYLNDVDHWMLESFGVSLFPKDTYALDEIPYRIEVRWVLQVVLGAFVTSLVAAFLPARRAARMEPVRALAYE